MIRLSLSRNVACRHFDGSDETRRWWEINVRSRFVWFARRHTFARAKRVEVVKAYVMPLSMLHPLARVAFVKSSRYWAYRSRASSQISTLEIVKLQDQWHCNCRPTQRETWRHESGIPRPPPRNRRIFRQSSYWDVSCIGNDRSKNNDYFLQRYLWKFNRCTFCFGEKPLVILEVQFYIDVNNFTYADSIFCSIFLWILEFITHM